MRSVVRPLAVTAVLMALATPAYASPFLPLHTARKLARSVARDLAYNNDADDWSAPPCHRSTRSIAYCKIHFYGWDDGLQDSCRYVIRVKAYPDGYARSRHWQDDCIG